MRQFLPLLLISFIASCTGIPESEPHFPLIKFKDPVKKRSVNLTNYFPEEFILQSNGKEEKYRVEFERKTRLSHLIKNQDDTVFSGTAIKIKDKFIINQQNMRGDYSIFAITINDTAIKGITTESAQMEALTILYMYDYFTPTWTDSLDNKLISINKKQADTLFDKVLEKIPFQKYVEIKEKDVTIIQERVAEQEGADIENNKTNSKIKTWPTKVHNVLHIESGETYKNMSFQIISTSGKVEKKGTLYANEISVDCSDLVSGNYFIIINEYKSQFIKE